MIQDPFVIIYTDLIKERLCICSSACMCSVPQPHKDTKLIELKFCINKANKYVFLFDC